VGKSFAIPMVSCICDEELVDQDAGEPSRLQPDVLKGGDPFEAAPPAPAPAVSAEVAPDLDRALEEDGADLL
jgi:hypothetical protein